ncbi:hypothetical protein L228DRAFT_251222 [Xylona heveae TC161]|uniref:HNH nuclease domain-containing protein n=1 Tax=Xylona heveae (strain CBS 132557 / TC161) TaxID=1328760 RepID=A0A164ZI98_XYLHT|nr:hypothetical protein L228DRAFT_251222 [Xylona heveae TC161]KZF19131.1 hypothetical protein L228DRAFT_251222 [Xylona heveae TC161]
MPGFRNNQVARNVHFLDGRDDEILGFMQTGSVTWGEMDEWLHIVISMPETAYSVWTCVDDHVAETGYRHGTQITLAGNPTVIAPGFYSILSPEGDCLQVNINEERVPPRTVSFSLSNPDPRQMAFQRRVRNRDMRCVVSREEVFDYDFVTFHAAHIFPLAHLDLWRTGNWAAVLSDDEMPGSSGIHSVQNGILLDQTIHTLFDKYLVAMDPDNNYKITYFKRKTRMPGNGEPMYLNPDYPAKYQPSRALLKYHFRMAVLCNLKGRGAEYDWDEDITPGMDSVKEISGSEQGKLRFELEVASRLNALEA